MSLVRALEKVLEEARKLEGGGSKVTSPTRDQIRASVSQYSTVDPTSLGISQYGGKLYYMLAQWSQIHHPCRAARIVTFGVTDWNGIYQVHSRCRPSHSVINLEPEATLARHFAEHTGRTTVCRLYKNYVGQKDGIEIYPRDKGVQEAMDAIMESRVSFPADIPGDALEQLQIGIVDPNIEMGWFYAFVNLMLSPHFMKT